MMRTSYFCFGVILTFSTASTLLQAKEYVKFDDIFNPTFQRKQISEFRWATHATDFCDSLSLEYELWAGYNYQDSDNIKTAFFCKLQNAQPIDTGNNFEAPQDTTTNVVRHEELITSNTG